MLAIARFLHLFLVAVLAGLLVGVALVERALLEVGPSVYTAVQKPKHEVFAPVMPVLDTLVIAAGLLVLILMNRTRRPLAPGAVAFTAAGVVCTIALTVTTVLVNVPINAEIIGSWSVEHPPADWAQVRDRWNLFHTIRTVVALLALVCLLVTALRPAPHGRAGTAGGRTRSGAQDRGDLSHSLPEPPHGPPAVDHHFQRAASHGQRFSHHLRVNPAPRSRFLGFIGTHCSQSPRSVGEAADVPPLILTGKE